MKPSSIGEPEVYLGSFVGKVLYGNGSYAWKMSSDSYVKKSINNVKKRLKEDGMEHIKKLSDVNYFPNNLFSSVDYKPELDTSVECNEYQMSL